MCDVKTNVGNCYSFTLLGYIVLPLTLADPTISFRAAGSVGFLNPGADAVYDDSDEGELAGEEKVITPN